MKARLHLGGDADKVGKWGCRVRPAHVTAPLQSGSELASSESSLENEMQNHGSDARKAKVPSVDLSCPSMIALANSSVPEGFV